MPSPDSDRRAELLPRPESRPLRAIGHAFNAIHGAWDRMATRRLVARSLIGAFLASLLLIELARLGIAPTFFGITMPTNHLHAISWVVTLLLIIETLDLIFGLADSVANALGKQLEIVSLILLRKTFDELPSFPEPVAVAGHYDAVYRIAWQAGGALTLFALLIVYYRLQRHEKTFRDRRQLADFIGLKQGVSLLLLTAFVVVGGVAGVDSLTLASGDGALSLRFFEVFFTILIFADILIALASIGSGRGYRVVFRNFAFALVTVMLRLALSTGPGTNALLATAAALFALGVSAVFLASADVLQDDAKEPAQAS